MSKINLSTVSSGYNQLSSVNSNFESIEQELQSKVLYRDNPTGEPNQMENDLDLNGHSILNLGTSTAGSSPITRDELQNISDTIQYSVVLQDIANGTVSNETASRSATTGDEYSYIRFTGSAPVNFTIDPDSTYDFADGREITVRQAGTGLVTLVAGTGVTLNTPANGTLVLGGQGATVTLKKVGDNEWDVMGQVQAAS